MAEEKDLKLSQGAMTRLHKNFDLVVGNKDFGNGRYVRNLFEKTIQNQAMRLSCQPNITADELSMLKAGDLPTNKQ